jgi:glycosyl hydrolase family 123
MMTLWARIGLVSLWVLGAGCAGTAWAATVADDDVEIETNHLRLLMPARAGGVIEEFGLVNSTRDLAAGAGLLFEGFGVGNFYVPNRRLNAKLSVLDSVTDRPVVQYAYDCDGPNIKGLHVTRTVEPFVDEASVRVRWTMENRGEEDQWVAPWVRNDIAPGGSFDENDRIDVPTLDGVRAISHTGYYPASRNWIAATDPIAKETVYAVFNADHLHSFQVTRGPEAKHCSLQAAFVPQIHKKGGTWETQYRINVVRGLTHVDFATEELAAQVDYAPGRLTLMLAAAKKLPPVQFKASVISANGRVWRLPAKKFSIDPDTVIRCTYDWTAPADGAYELLALLLQDDEPYDLGQGVAPPHGGIDTQFIVGNPRQTRMEAWTDAPHALDRGPRQVKRDMAVPGDTAIWFESPLEKIFREDIPLPAGKYEPTARIALARNERESFQLVIHPPEGTDLHQMTLRPQALVNRISGARIDPSNITLSRVEYTPVRVPTHFEGPTGLWPDPLPTLAPFTAPGGICTPLWVTVYAPPGTAPGVYTGILELSGPTLDPLEFWVEAQVYDFDLPVTPALKTDFGFSREGTLEACTRMGYTGTAQALEDAYAANALAHRVTLRELTQLPAESADYPASLKAYEPRLKELLAQGASSIAVPPSLLGAPEQLKLADAFVTRLKLTDRAFCHIGDDPPQPAWPRLFERMNQWNEIAPDIPLMVTTYGLQPFLPDLGDIWAVHAPMFDTTNNRVLLERISQDGEVWTYVHHNPPRPYGNFFTDFAAMEHRMLFWQAWALGLSGFHYWNASYIEPHQDPWAGQVDQTPANGNGLLLYPSAGGPVSSIRWESIRDGLEDYDYLALLRQRMRKAKEAKADPALLERADKAYDVSALLTNLVSFSRDPQILAIKRDAIAKAIEELAEYK